MSGYTQHPNIINGIVLNGHMQPLVAASVKVKGQNNVVATDDFGKFKISATDQDFLEVSKQGYITLEEPVYDTALRIVLGIDHPDIISSSLKQEAAFSFRLRDLPKTKSEWEHNRIHLLKKIKEATGLHTDHSLSLDYHETGSIQMNGYVIKKIYFQTQPGIYATANLYVPDGKGVFPAVINMNGHWENAKAADMVQSVAHELALNGYVCLCMDTWGAGERSTVHGISEYHGSNLGASLMNIGEPLMGKQIADNMRGVDLLCSLPYVDKNNIGATGASGGGNQTMWLSALDTRIKASMPVVSVGTFQSYVMESNCICELLPGGLSFTEESGVIALIAPRAVQFCNALRDENPTFQPYEMIRTYNKAKSIFALYDKEENIRYRLFNTTHGYWPEMRQSLISWFDLQLKGIKTSETRKEIPFTLLPNEKLMVFPEGKRLPSVMGTYDYCMLKGKALSDSFYADEHINFTNKKEALHELLFLKTGTESPAKIQYLDTENIHRELLLTTGENRIIPVRYFSGKNKNSPVVVIFSNTDTTFLNKRVSDYIQNGYSVVVASVWGVGENSSAEAIALDYHRVNHTLSRSAIWLGHSMIGNWVEDMQQVINYVQHHMEHSSISIDAEKEMAVAALIQSALYNNVDTCFLRKSPVSYLIDRKEGIDYFNMALHLPGILNWGDISLMIALNKRAWLIFEHPVSITGENITDEKLSLYTAHFSKMLHAAGNKNNFVFSNNQIQ
ncbi:MAG TPA: acetylxylan esterase [Puia sp.]|nr:acetylxylan esterase [Puia sp.]